MRSPRIKGRSVLSNSIHRDGLLLIRVTLQNPRMNGKRTGCQSITRRRTTRVKKSAGTGECFRCVLAVPSPRGTNAAIGRGRPSRENQPGAGEPIQRGSGANEKPGRTQLLSCCNLAIITSTTQRLMKAFGACRGSLPPNWREVVTLRLGRGDSFIGRFSLTGCRDGGRAHQEAIA